MAENSKIEWTTHTFNSWRGCFKVSPGCAHCYAEVSAPSRVARGSGIETWGKNAARIVASESMWAEPLKWNRQAEGLSERPRVFCASLADVFEDYQGGNVCDSQGNKLYDDLTTIRARLFDLIRRTPHLDWLLLTKRPENVIEMLREAMDYIFDHWSHFNDQPRGEMQSWLHNWIHGNPPHSVWIGTTCENQDAADKRIPELLKIPARVRFLSVEPMLGPVDLTQIPTGQGHGYNESDPIVTMNSLNRASVFAPHIHWVICGGESGNNARPMHPDWARSLRDQCQAARVPFLFKQWGEYCPVSKDNPLPLSEVTKMRAINEEGCFVERMEKGTSVIWKSGKKAAGRTLDGQIHNEFPEVSK